MKGHKRDGHFVKKYEEKYPNHNFLSNFSNIRSRDFLIYKMKILVLKFVYLLPY